MSENIRVLLPEDELAERIAELGAQISKDYEGETVFLVCILNGASFFACELAKRITIPVTMDFMAVSSYGNGMVSAGEITVRKELDEDIYDKEVLIVEDILDSGVTLYNLKVLLSARSPKSLKIITLLDKKENHETDIQADYVGFDIPNQFVVGYGLDYAQKHRNLPYVGVVVED